MGKKNDFWKQVYQESYQQVRKELGTVGEIMKLTILIIFCAFALALAAMLGLSKVLNIQSNYVEFGCNPYS